jgi:Protein of unknown function (DUF2568)
VLGALTPLAAAVVWGTFLSPRASVRLPTVPKVALRLAVLLGGAVALAAAGREWLAVAFAAIMIVDELVLVAIGRPIAGADS